ncbi:MAG: phage BR0599 family protein [Stenotrophomonas sp.]
MAFDLREVSRFLGQPVHLFVFARKHLVWRFNSSTRPITIDGATYLPASISRSAIRQTAERAKDKITIRFPYLRDPAAGEYPPTQSLGDNWHPYPPGDMIHVTCKAYHHGDAEAVVEWMGRVTQPRFTDTELELTCEPGRPRGNFSGLSLRWQRSCPLALYSQGVGMCGVAAADHALPASLTAASGLTLTASAFGSLPAGRLAGGYVEWERGDGLTERRSIMAHAGSTIEINYGAQMLAPGVAVIAYPGCAHTANDCKDYFNNMDRFGGCPYLPVKNPFDGMPVW